MTSRSASGLHRWVVGLMAGIIVVSIAAWQLTREKLPRLIRIASGASGGLYHQFATVLGRELEERTGRRAVALASRGSVVNRERLRAGEVEIGILQGGAVPAEGLEVVAPLYHEVV